jgi:cytochrome c biogenesis protein CcmG/thiol:disulfide interchange protein DsbE
VSNRPNPTASRSAKVAQASGAGRRSNTLLWVILAAVVVIAGIVALAVTRDSGQDGGGASPSGGTVVPAGDLDYGTVSVEGTPLPVSTGTTATDPAIGEALPTIEGQQFDGSPITIEGGSSPMIVMGIAHWCPHCRAEVPRIQEWLDQHGMPTDVDLVAVATDTDASRVNFSPGDWLRREGWSVPTMADDQDDTAGQALGISSFPTFVVVGADGQVVLRATGELSTAQWEALLEVARTGEVPS